MSRGLLALIIVGLPLAAAGIAGASDYRAGERERTIGATIDALRAAGDDADAIARRLARERRSRCQGGSSDLRLRCLLEIGESVCAERAGAERERCALIVDVAMTNLLSESWFISEGQRYALMREGGDLATAIAAELLRRYAELAAEMSFSPRFDADALAPSIDGFCVERAHHSRLAWQRCVAAIVWYIGSHP